MSTNYKFQEAQNKLVTEANRKASAYLLTKYGSARLIGEPKVELVAQTNPISNAIEFTGHITCFAAPSNGLKEIGINMTVNENAIEVDSEDIVADVTNAMNAAADHAETVVSASLDAFQLLDDGSKYLKVSHPALEDANLGVVGKNEFAASPDKSELLQSIAKDAMTRVANETKINFTGEFKEPIIEKQPVEKKAESEMVPCPGCKNPYKIEWHGYEAQPEAHSMCPECEKKEDMSVKKSWLTADLMSEDPEPYADSEQIDENEKYVLWQTPYADHTSYWVSDKTGAELASFSTEADARAAMETGTGLEILDEASKTMPIKEDMPMARMSDHLAQSAQLEEQTISAAKEEMKIDAANSVISMLQSLGYGSAKIASIELAKEGFDVMTYLEDGGTTKAVNIAVTVKDAKVILPKKSLVSTLISKGLDIRARLSEDFSKEILEKIASIEELENYREAEANAILAEKPTVTKTASDSSNSQFLGDTDVLTVQKHLLPNHQDLKKGDKVSDGADQWEIVDTEAQQNDKNEGSSSLWKLRKCAPPKSDEKTPDVKMPL